MTDFDPLLAHRPLPPPTRPAAPTPAPAAVHASPRRRPRRHAAQRARITTAGIGISTMLGLVASMGIANAVTDDSAAPLPAASTPLETSPPAMAPATAPLAAASTPPMPAGNTDGATSPTTSAPAPVTLTARPEVRVITPPAAQTPAPAPAPAPAATTRGSR